MTEWMLSVRTSSRLCTGNSRWASTPSGEHYKEYIPCPMSQALCPAEQGVQLHLNIHKEGVLPSKSGTPVAFIQTTSGS